MLVLKFGNNVFSQRYTVVLQIFKIRAQTREAKLQVALAELPYIRYHIILLLFIIVTEEPQLGQAENQLKTLNYFRNFPL